MAASAAKHAMIARGKACCSSVVAPRSAWTGTLLKAAVGLRDPTTAIDPRSPVPHPMRGTMGHSRSRTKLMARTTGALPGEGELDGRQGGEGEEDGAGERDGLHGPHPAERRRGQPRELTRTNPRPSNHRQRRPAQHRNPSSPLVGLRGTSPTRNPSAKKILVRERPRCRRDHKRARARSTARHERIIAYARRSCTSGPPSSSRLRACQASHVSSARLPSAWTRSRTSHGR